jgi:hypothetical protein
MPRFSTRMLAGVDESIALPGAFDIVCLSRVVVLLEFLEVLILHLGEDFIVAD